MKIRILKPLVITTLIAAVGIAQAATIIVTNSASSGPGSLDAAIAALNDGDTIAFNIPGAGPHYIQTPADGYPLITKNNITIDGYTQPGAIPNSNPIHAANNAVLKIVLTSTNGNALAMQTACETSWGSAIPRLGYGNDEQAVLGFFHATNALIRGLVIQASHNTTTSQGAGTCKAICFAANSAENGGNMCENWRVSGCWFGVDPVTKQVAYCDDPVLGAGTVATPRIAIASYRTRNAAAPDNTVYNVPGTIGVAAGSANPRADFNVFVTGYGYDSEGYNYRISGNFYGVLPDGVTCADMSVLNGGAQQGDGFIEIGRVTSNLIIGTDGDGVNDADEGNVFGGSANDTNPGTIMNFYSDPRTNIVIAGNWFNLGVDGVTRFTNSAPMVDGFGGVATVQIGSDFDGVSDALEANRIYNITNSRNLFINGTGGSINPGARVSMRGNETVNNELIPYSYANGLSTRLANFTNYALPFMDVNSANGIIPTLAKTNTFPQLTGTFAPGIAPYTNIILDVYELDPDGWTNGQALNLTELVDPNTSGFYGFPQGRRYLGSFPVPNTGSFDITLPANSGVVTVTANYSADPVGTPKGRVHTSNFSNPGYPLPGGANSVGLTRIVPDTIVWFNGADNTPRVGGLIPGSDVSVGGSVEATAGVLGDSTFLLAATTKADDGTSMRFTSVYQPAAGGTPKLGDLFYSDSGVPYTNQINASRQDGNPGRVAGDPRYGAVNIMGAGEVSLWAYPTFFNSDGRFSVTLPFYAAMQTGNARDACVQTFALNPFTLSQAMLSKAKDSAFGGLTGSAPGAGASGDQLSRTGGTVAGLDNGNFVSVVEDRSRLLNPNGNASTATIFAPDGTVVKAAFKVADADQWANVGAYRGGFYVRPSGGKIYFFDNAGNLQGELDHNATSGIGFDNGRGDGTRTCSDIRSHYVFMAGNAGGETWLAVFDANTRSFVTKALVTDTDPALQAVDRVNVACDAYDRVCVAWRLRPDKNTFLNQQVAARVLSFDGTKVSYLTHSFFPFINHDSEPNVNTFVTQEPSVAMTPRQIFIYAEGTVNSTNNPAGPADSLPQTHLYTVLSHPAPIAAPRPTVTLTKSGDNLNLSWNPDDGLFTVQTRSSVTAGAWANATAGNVAPPVSIPAGAGPQFIRLAR